MGEDDGMSTLNSKINESVKSSKILVFLTNT